MTKNVHPPSSAKATVAKVVRRSTDPAIPLDTDDHKTLLECLDLECEKQARLGNTYPKDPCP